MTSLSQTKYLLLLKFAAAVTIKTRVDAESQAQSKAGTEYYCRADTVLPCPDVNPLPFQCAQCDDIFTDYWDDTWLQHLDIQPENSHDQSLLLSTHMMIELFLNVSGQGQQHVGD